MVISSTFPGTLEEIPAQGPPNRQLDERTYAKQTYRTGWLGGACLCDGNWRLWQCQHPRRRQRRQPRLRRVHGRWRDRRLIELPRRNALRGVPGGNLGRDVVVSVAVR